MTVILRTAVGLSANIAAAATILIRFFTLWFGVILGVITVIVWRKLLFGGSDLRVANIETELIDSDLAYEQKG